MFVLLVPLLLQQVWYKLLTICNKLVDCCKVVPTSLIQPWYNKNVTRSTTQCCNNIVISWLYQTCWNNLATSLIISTRLLQIVNNCCILVDNLGQAVRTTCWQLVGRLVTSCEIFACVGLGKPLLYPNWFHISYKMLVMVQAQMPKLE